MEASESDMYKLMKSEKYVLEYPTRRPLTLFRQEEIKRFRALHDATSACEVANETADARHYILDGAGREFYAGSWLA
jgi:hypothetical protein